MNQLGINMQTVFGMPPVELVHLAGDLGCSHVSSGLLPVPWKLDEFPDWSLREDRALRRELIAAMRARGVTLSLVEGFAIRPGVDVAAWMPDLDLVCELGGQGVSTVAIGLERSRAFEQIALLAELTAERNIRLSLEFAPPHTVENLQAAVSVIRKVGRPNATVLVDAMHFFRSGGTVAQLATLEPGIIGYVQLCDAPLVGTGEDYYTEASFERMRPGEGALPLAELVAALSDDLPLGLEVPMRSAISALGLHDSTQRIVQAARRILEVARPSHAAADRSGQCP